jgi:CDGSH-type Zn-finger protein
MVIEVMENGPILIKTSIGKIFVKGEEKGANVVALCRCGQSSKKPFCDGSHMRCEFQGTSLSLTVEMDEPS